MKHDLAQNFSNLNLNRYLGKPERIVDAITDHYGLNHVEATKAGVMHFLRLLQRNANAEDLSDLVLVSTHLIFGLHELEVRRNEARQARKEWQASGIAHMSSKDNSGGNGAELRERFQKARHRAESIEEKIENISHLVSNLLTRHAQVMKSDPELALALEKRREATINSHRWIDLVDELYDDAHEGLTTLKWGTEHKRLDGLWGDGTSSDHRGLVIEAVHAYLSDVAEMTRAVDASLMHHSLDEDERERAESRLKDLRRLNTHVVEQLERARALPDMLAIEAAALEELTLGELPDIDDLQASQDIQARPGSRLKAKNGQSSQPRVEDVAVATPSQRMAATPAAPPAPAPVAYPEADDDEEDSLLEMQLAELAEMLETQGAEMESLLEAKLALETELEEALEAASSMSEGVEGEGSREEIEALEARLKAAQREKREERQAVEERDEEIHRLKTRETDLERELRKARDEGGDSGVDEEEHQRLLDKKAELKNDNKRFRKELEKANKAINRLNRDIETARAEAGIGGDEDFERLRDECDKLTARVEEAETDVRSRDLEIERLENEIQEQIQDHKETHHQLKSVADRSQKLEEALEQKRELIEELSDSLDRRQLDADRNVAELQRREERIHELREELRETASELQETSEAYAQFRHENERRDRRIDHLEDMLGERLREVEELNLSVEERSSQLREVMGQLDHATKQVKERGNDIERLADALDDSQLELERFRKELESERRESERQGYQMRTLEDEVTNRDREIARLYELVEASTLAQQEAKRETKRVVEETRQERDQLRAEVARLRELESNFERERDALRQRILNDEDQKRQLLDALAQKDEERRFEQRELLEELREVRRESSSRNDALRSLSSRMDEMQTKMDTGSTGFTERRKKPRLSTDEIRQSARYETSITEISDMLRRADSAQSSEERDSFSGEISKRLDRLIRDAGGTPPAGGAKLILPEESVDRDRARE